jgi:hypothetical protein
MADQGHFLTHEFIIITTTTIIVIIIIIIIRAEVWWRIKVWSSGYIHEGHQMKVATTTNYYILYLNVAI